MFGLVVRAVMLLGLVGGAGYAVVKFFLSQDRALSRLARVQADLETVTVQFRNGALDAADYDAAVEEILAYARARDLPVSDPRRALPAPAAQ